MDIVLSDLEVRILGCLIEKEMTTPEYYPLSLNALANACNQKSNRNPVVSYDEAAVASGLDSLQEKGFARRTMTPGSRVVKYLHVILDKFDLSRHEVAILCELMLRGPQTPGELRSHAERMSPFENLEEVEKTLQGLAEHDPPLALRLPREPGRKESRHMHLLSGRNEPAVEDVDHSVLPDDRISALENELSKLRNELEELKNAFGEFKARF